MKTIYKSLITYYVPLIHCEQTVLVVLAIYLSVGNYQQTHTYLSLHFWWFLARLTITEGWVMHLL